MLQGRRNRGGDDGECAGQPEVPRKRPGAGVRNPASQPVVYGHRSPGAQEAHESLTSRQSRAAIAKNNTSHENTKHTNLAGKNLVVISFVSSWLRGFVVAYQVSRTPARLI